MARYQLPKPQSMYRDTGLVENTKLFRQRYVQNMAADDALAQAVLEMTAMEQDTDLKNSLIEKYNAQLKYRATQDNYHMQGVAIMKDARNFKNEYQPIANQVTKFQTYHEKLREDLEKERITPFTYEGKLKQSLMNYKGLKPGEAGGYDPNSEFSGANYTYDIDPMAEIDAGMEAVIPRIIDSLGMEYQANLKGEIFTQPDPTGAPAYYIKYGEKIKEIPPHIIQEVAGNVLTDDSVIMSIAQETELRNLGKDQIAEGNDVSAATTEVDKSLNDLALEIDELEKKRGTKKWTENDELKLENLIRKEEDYLEARENEDVNELTLLNAIRAEDRRQGYYELAMTKYGGVLEYKESRDFTEGARYNQMMKNRLDNMSPNFAANVGVEGLQLPIFGGETESSINSQLTITEENMQVYKNNPQLGEAFMAEVMKVNDEDGFKSVATKFEVSVAYVRTAKAEISQYNTLQDVLKNRILTAYTNEFGEGVTPGNYDFYISNTVEQNNPELALNIQNAYSNVMGEGPSMLPIGEIINAMENDPTLKEKIRLKLVELELENNPIPQLDPNIPDASGNQQARLEREHLNPINKKVNNNLTSITTSYNTMHSEGKQSVNNYLGATPTVKLDNFIIPEFGDPTGNTAEAVNSWLKTGIDEDFEFEMNGVRIAYKDLKDHESGDNKELGKNSPIYKKKAQRFWNKEGIEFLDASLVAYPRIDGEGLLALRFKNADGKVETIYAPTNQIKVSGLNNYTNKQVYNVWELYNAGQYGNNLSYSPAQFIDHDPNSEFAGQKTVEFRYSEQLVYILDTDKKSPNYGKKIPYPVAAGLEAIANSLEHYNQTL